MSNHSPGPWFATKIARSLAWKVTRTPDEPRGDICNVISGLGSPNAEADARLIAIAPGLFLIAQRLSALREALENGNSSAEFDVCKLAEQAQSLVARVEGEQE